MHAACLALVIQAVTLGADPRVDALQQALLRADQVLAAQAGQRIHLVPAGDGRLAASNDPPSTPARESWVLAVRDGAVVAVFHEVHATDDGTYATATHYFDAAGNTIAFKRTAAMRQSGCPDAAAEPVLETSMTVYLADARTRTDTLKDAWGLDLQAADCTSLRRTLFRQYRTARELADAELQGAPRR